MIVTSWDKFHCSSDEIELLKQYTNMWETGNEDQKKKAAENAQAIRAKYRMNGEYATGDGNTGINGMHYSTYYYIGDTILSQGSQEILDIVVNMGVGLGGTTKIGGIGVEMCGAMYYDLETIFTDVPKQTASFTADIQATNMAKIGASLSRTINAASKEHLYYDGYIGLKAGKKLIGYEMPLLNRDIIFDIRLGGYFIVGGELVFNVNVSELLERVNLK